MLTVVERGSAQTRTIDNRLVLATIMPQGGRVAEVGVFMGQYSRDIIIYNNPDRLFLIDPWHHHFDPTNVHITQMNQQALDYMYKMVEATYKDHPRVHVMRRFSPAAAQLFPDHYFDWVYIDADHRYKYVAADLRGWWPKIRSGGYLSGHDYRPQKDHRYFGVKRAVDEFVHAHSLVLSMLSKEKLANYAIQKSLRKPTR